MGFWHTGYIEFHEPSGLDFEWTPRPTRYFCQHCEASFETEAELRRHRFENHAFSRPILVVRGREVGNAPLRVVEILGAGDIAFEHVTAITVNGTDCPPSRLEGALRQVRRDTVHVAMENETGSAEFTLEFDVPDASDLAGVDGAFLQLAKGGRLDSRAIEQFIDACRHDFSSAMGYCDGICEYLYGVLAREGAASDSLPFGNYPEKFNRAADRLRDFSRPLAGTITALVGFHFNHFEEALIAAPDSRVGGAARRFQALLSGPAGGVHVPVPRRAANQSDRLLSDLSTARVIDWAELEAEELIGRLDDMRALLAQRVADFDAVKIQVLMAEALVAGGRAAEARRLARELSARPGFAPWAEGMLGRLERGEAAP